MCYITSPSPKKVTKHTKLLHIWFSLTRDHTLSLESKRTIMAGLHQYYFFPTDFFYPRPKSLNKETSIHQQQIIHPLVQVQKGDTEDDRGIVMKSLVDPDTRNNKLVIKASPSSSLLLAPIYKEKAHGNPRV